MKFYVIFVTLLFFLSFINLSSAQVSDVQCSSLKEFGGGLEAEITSEKVSYNQGDKVKLILSLNNKMQIPIVDGTLRVQILYVDNNGNNNLIDEFILPQKISLNKGTQATLNLEYQTTHLPNGKYKYRVFLIIADKFSVVSNTISTFDTVSTPLAETTFTISSSDKKLLIFDPKDILINNESFTQIGSYIKIKKTNSLDINVKLINNGDEKNVDITLEVFTFDNLFENPITTYTQKKSISVNSNSKQELTFAINNLNQPNYLIKLEAKSGNQKSILKIPINDIGSMVGLQSAFLNKFPLVNGEKNSIVACVFNSVISSKLSEKSIKLNVRLLDENGNEIASASKEANILTDYGFKFDFNPNKNLNNAVLEINLFDSQNKLLDKASIKYDLSQFLTERINLELKTSKSQYLPTEEIPILISLKDEFGNNVRGKILIYLLDDKDMIVFINENTEIANDYVSKINPVSKLGNYKLVARDVERDLKASKQLVITNNPQPEPTIPITPVPKGIQPSIGLNTTQIIVLIVVVVIIILYLAWRGNIFGK